MKILTKVAYELTLMRDIVSENSLGTYVRLRLRKLLKQAKSVDVVINGETLCLRAVGPDLTVARTCRHEFESLAHMFDKDTEGVIVDAGGFIGTAALALSRLYPKAKIVTIEPSSENLVLLHRNVADKDNIEVIHAALVPDDGPETLELFDRKTGPWGFSIMKNGGAGTSIETVATLKISDLLDRLDGATIMIFKMDIEGAEAAILQENSAWLDRSTVFMVELHEDIAPGCHNLFLKTNAERCVLTVGGEKYLSIGPKYFSASA